MKLTVQRNEPLIENLDWDVNDEQNSLILSEQVQHSLVAPLHWGPGTNALVVPPPPVSGTDCNHISHSLIHVRGTEEEFSWNYYFTV